MSTTIFFNLLAFFYKIRHILPYKVLATIYYAIVHPHLLYGIEIYGNTHRSYLNKSMVLNNKLLRILQNASRNGTKFECIMIRDNVFTLPNFYTIADVQCMISYLCSLG